ncbi:MAG TPA: hypothetical protein VGJ59_17605 [Jatrophihabitantaceae bacterium]|jgi:hypothetical protein
MISYRCRPLLLSAVLVVPLLAALPASALAASPKPPANSCGPVAQFSAHHFPQRPEIDNRWLPLVPWTNTELRGTVRSDDGKLHQHSIVATVTDLTKVIDGVRTLVVFERDLDNGQLQESELAFEAQDRSGRVWNVGEYPEEYEDGQLAGAPSTWIAGIAGARAGIGMLGHPRLHTTAYEQGRAPTVGFFDCGKVTKTRQQVCVPVGCFGNVIVIDEWAPLEPEGGHQLKYYAPHIGTIKVGAVGGDTPEVLTLVKIGKLGGAALAKIRAQVIAQDRRGYRVSKKVYGLTPQVQRLTPVHRHHCR